MTKHGIRSSLPSIVATALLLVLVWAVNTALAQGPVGDKQPAGGGGPPTPVPGRINYQGVLKENGAPVTGNRNLTFDFFTNNTCSGVSIYNQVISSVSVNNGLFSVAIDLPSTSAYGQALYVRLTVGAFVINCDEVRPVPYAYSLKPGAQIYGDPLSFDGSALSVIVAGYYPSGSAIYAVASTGSGVMGNVPDGTGVYGTTAYGMGVYGSSTGITNARGYGGYFYSASGVGVFGQSNAGSYYTNMYAPGVYGKSANGAGVYGKSTGATWPAYGGVFEGRAGVTGRGSGSSSYDGYGGIFVGENYRGLYAQSFAGYYDAYFPGTGGIYSAGGIFSMAGASTIAVNGGAESLAPGDVVAIAGVSTVPGTNQMVLSVRKVDTTTASAVVGVVGQTLRGEQKEVVAGAPSFDLQLTNSPAANGGYVSVVTSGLAMVNVGAATSAPAIGDWLAVSSGGTVARAAEVSGMTPALIGKAAGPVDPKTGLMPVFVILH
ncbi:MAG: hypothetical protein HZB53_09145 [Chloroflexi bacterium]|nr:hypothetical protein [Chloroflexota bacterium]